MRWQRGSPPSRAAFFCCQSVTHQFAEQRYARNERRNQERTFWLVVLKQGAGPACRDPFASCFLHAMLYNKARGSPPTGDGASAARCSYQDGLLLRQRRKERRKWERRLEEVSVNNAIGFQLLYAQALMQNSALLYVGRDVRPRQEARGYVLPGWSCCSLSNSEGKRSQIRPASVFIYFFFLNGKNINCPVRR